MEGSRLCARMGQTGDGRPSCLIFHVCSSIATEQRKECKGRISGFADKKLDKKSLNVSKKKQEG